MFSETATELIRGPDYTGFLLAVGILVLVKIFVYFSSKCK